MFALPAVHPRDWSSINGLVEAVPRPFWKLLQNRSNAVIHCKWMCSLVFLHTWYKNYYYSQTTL